MLLRQHALRLLCAFAIGAGFLLCSCGSNTPPAPAAALSASSIGCPGNNAPCSGSVVVPQLLVDGTDPATYGLPMTCSVTANANTMKFSATPSMPWFGVSPYSGTLQPNGSTTLGVVAINATNVSSRNIGNVTVSASQYKDNSQMAVELNCDMTAGTCKVAFSCNPKTDPLP